MVTKFKLAATSFVALAAVLTFIGCKPQADHPNQLNTFDGASYDSLTLAHGALVSLRAQVLTSYPKYGSVFNKTAAAYSAAFNAYSVYRVTASTTDQVQVTAAITNLAVSIVALENAFQTDMHVSASSVAHIRAKAKQIRAAAGPNVSVADILTELEIAAAIAQTIPQAQPYAALAATVIAATNEALAAEKSADRQPIDLTTIQPIAAIQ
jgi:hypothetical protein